MGAKYLCCLPLRLGVLVVSFLQFLASGIVSAGLVAVIILDSRACLVPGVPESKPEKVLLWAIGTGIRVIGDWWWWVKFSGSCQGGFGTKLPSRTRIIVIVLAAIYAIIALISLTGFIGAIRKSVSNVRAFSRLVQFFLVVQVAAVVAFFILYFVDKKDFNKICESNDTLSDTCDSTRRLPLWSMLVSTIVPLLFQAYGVYIVSAYVHKLQDESFLKEESFGFKGPGYMPVSEESHPLTYQPHYPYADNTHSFGNSGRV
ncbi:hypothetical protein FB45DRAFT_860738 [Roridomyces roridus]|uniref:Uncharacterized protein n=1 Tax=Roridomyces roridus TaxID=1738132 RepID=A0AAD7G0A5_9AGAR|nr:hypothetical protein FB45DRAFT_860738 [Roridomyces roridus]